MLILDTNVVSEIMRPNPDNAVWGWVATQAPATLHTTSITLAEMLYGIGIMPDGLRSRSMSQTVGRIFADYFPDRILPFDRNAAVAYAAVMAGRRRIGKPIQIVDAQIAAIARAHGATVATRNMRDFSDCGIDVVNPWQP